MASKMEANNSFNSLTFWSSSNVTSRAGIGNTFVGNTPVSTDSSIQLLPKKTQKSEIGHHFQ